MTAAALNTFPAIIAAVRITTPLGEMVAGASADGICMLEFADRLEAKKEHPRRHPGRNLHLDELRRELDLYFTGRLCKFLVPLDTAGTEFQKKVWQALQTIPYGQTRSYKQQAVMIGQPKAVRAVGMANGANPIAIIVPCHRVIGADGRLTGYGGGLWRKRFLLDLEQKNLK
jgi:AraC family transcriptional regulator of adaptative response/methylated-DNA-[protein]-cysteine methyltransferase